MRYNENNISSSGGLKAEYVNTTGTGSSPTVYAPSISTIYLAMAYGWSNSGINVFGTTYYAAMAWGLKTTDSSNGSSRGCLLQQKDLNAAPIIAMNGSTTINIYNNYIMFGNISVNVFQASGSSITVLFIGT